MKPAQHKHLFAITFGCIVFLELLSFLGWQYPVVGSTITLLLWLLTAYVAIKDLRFGVAIILAELIIGSHGLLFSFASSYATIPLRYGLFAAVMLGTIVSIYKERKIHFGASRFFLPYLALLVVLGLATIHGILQGHGIAATVSDANAFAFLLLAFPLWQAVRSTNDLNPIVHIAAAAGVASILKVHLLFYTFSHGFAEIQGTLYRWVRDTRIGEITIITDEFARIFFASHITTIVLFFIGYMSALFYAKKRVSAASLYVLSFFFSSILISLSRSNWLGMTVAALVFLVTVIIIHPRTCMSIVRHGIRIGVPIILIAFASITLLLSFPFSSSRGIVSPLALFTERAQTIHNEAAANSRWQLLPPLWNEIKKTPVIGAGFGQTVTYISQDPKVIARTGGTYTTTTFEWGYFDLWLKLGALGLGIYLLFILKILIQTSKTLTTSSAYPLQLGILLGCIAMIVTHMFSPYLNHPLGITILLCTAMLSEMNPLKA